MRGERKARGLVERAGKIEGVNYKGDPAGVSAAWGGGAAGVATPAIGQYPTVTIPIDSNDDASDKLRVLRSASRSSRKVTRDTTKARFRSQLKTLANFIAWLMDLATGTRTFKSLTTDGTGGVTVAPVAGRISASQDVVAAGQLQSGGDTVVGGDAHVAGEGFIGGDVFATKIVVSASAVGATVPTSATPVKYALYKELIPAAWGIYTPTGGFLIQGVNIATAVRNFLGSFTFTLINPVAVGASNSVFVLATATGILFASANGNTTAGVTTINVFTYDATGAAADANEVSFLVFGA